MARGSNIGDRDWGKRPLFGSRRRRVLHWWILALVIAAGALLFLYPNLVGALLAPLLA